MLKKIFVSTIYSILIFSLVSYISVMVSLLQSIGEPWTKPVTNIGFPFKYYFQFWLRGSDSPNCGWSLKYFIYDALIVWSIVTTIYFIIKSYNKNKHH